MKWLNLEIRTLRSPEYIGSDPVERATWLSVLAYCCEQENGGRLAEARGWKDRQWQQLCGVTAREVRRASKLLTWEGDTLVVQSYPSAKEEEVRSRREAGREGGLRSGEARANPQRNSEQNGSSASSDASPDASSKPPCRASTEGEGEGNRKGREGERERKEKGREARGAASSSGRVLPKSLAEVQARAASFPVTGAVRRLPDAGFVEWWFDEQEKRGWCDPETGLPWHDWVAAFHARWRGYVHRQGERQSRAGGPTASRAQGPQHAPGDDRL